MRDVAKAAGTSVASVSATLHGTRGETIRVSQATRERIRAIADQLGYVANPIAKSLATGRTKVLGLMLPYADAFLDQNPFCNQVMHGVMSMAVRRHYNVMMYTAVAGILNDQAARLVDSRVDGLILVMPPSESNLTRQCERIGLPYVSVLQPPVPGRACVNADDELGGRLAARHLLELGHRHFGILLGSDDVSTTGPRRFGFLDELRQEGIEVPERWMTVGGFSPVSGHKAMIQMIEQCGGKLPSALFAANDLCAEGAMRALREHGFDIPDDVAIVGYDDTWFATMTRPPLTSVRMPISEMGESAAAILIDQLEGEPVAEIHPVLPVSLTVRQSSGASDADSTPRTATSPVLIQ